MGWVTFEADGLFCTVQFQSDNIEEVRTHPVGLSSIMKKEGQCNLPSRWGRVLRADAERGYGKPR